MNPFELFGVGRVVFGVGTFARVGELASPLGRSALVLYNGSGQVDPLVEKLSSAGVRSMARRQRGEPVVGDVDDAVRVGREAGCDLVIGLGGGSAIDAAKATAGLLTNGGSALDYLEIVGTGRKITLPALPWMAIPTTAGTGAEATRNAVIGMPERKFKASIRSERLLPTVVVIDPALGVGVPPDVTARSGMDALCQCVEAYTSNAANPVTDALALEGITLATRSLRTAFEDGANLPARTDMALAALLSGICLTSAGLGAVHGFAAPLGANFPVPHGTVCAALLPHVIAANVATLKASAEAGSAAALERYARVGRLFLPTTASADSALDACVSFTRDLARALQIPPLRGFGMRASDVPEMVKLARKASSMRFNPVVLSDETLGRVLRDAIEESVGLLP